MTRTIAWLAGLILTGAVAACTVPGAGLPELPEGGRSTYRLGAEDQVRVTVFDDTRLSGVYRIGQDGEISVPLVGRMRAAGMSPTELEQRLVREFRQRQLITTPAVAVEVQTYRPIFVLGLVERGGQFPYQPGMTVLSAVALAGGFNFRAVQDRVTVTRPAPDGTTATEYRAPRDAVLQPGDVVTVLERRF
ncbi:MAG: exopolysaccharide biosynthesis protein [Rhodospirillales bacterium]|jgi:polysaccharide export outer membrane protein|nr:exopolysaccharide biosynthesis protein [Rhodospirillales bacterium]MDB5383596.1 exopolysaccharide biosynthesis protein [Rhodospirillales bacterium]